MPELHGEPARGGLVAHRPDRGRRRPDPADAGGDDRLGEVGVLGEEPEARVDRVGAGRPCGRDDGIDREQVDGVGPVGRRDDRGDPEPRLRSGDPGGDLAAVGDEQRPIARGAIGVSSPVSTRVKRANRVIRDTPSTTNPPRRQPAGRDPALDRPRRRPDPARRLAGAVARRACVTRLSHVDLTAHARRRRHAPARAARRRPASAARRAAGWADLLREPGFRGLWLAQTVSQVGTQITFLAMPLVAILVLDAGPLEVGILGAVDFLPFLLFTLPAGVWVDRIPRRRILIVADVGRALVLAVVPAAYLTGTLAMWQLYVVGFAAGTLTVFFDVGYQAFLPELVPRDRLAEGNSRLEVSRSAAQVVGPGLAGFLVGAITAPIRDPRRRRELRRLGAVPLPDPAVGRPSASAA